MGSASRPSRNEQKPEISLSTADDTPKTKTPLVILINLTSNLTKNFLLSHHDLQLFIIELMVQSSSTSPTQKKILITRN